MTSPLLRVRQNLDLMLDSKAAAKHKPTIYEHIRHSDSPLHFINWTFKKTEFKKIIAVSYEPFMSHFMNAICAAAWLKLKIKKGQIIKIKISGDQIKFKVVG